MFTSFGAHPDSVSKEQINYAKKMMQTECQIKNGE
jgi:hypothetical protein